MRIIIKKIALENADDIRLPNEPFSLMGKLHPSYHKGIWSHEIEWFSKEQQGTMTFPNEEYDYQLLSQNSIFLGAYDGEQCIGLAILQHRWNRYLYLYDFKVNTAYRQQGVASLLMAEAKKVSKEEGYRGIFTQGQDNNLIACLFYLKNGFKIGGIDCCLYDGTKQEGKKDILFYGDNESAR